MQFPTVLRHASHKACYRALIRGEPKPEKVGGAPLPQPVWYECVRIKELADRKVRGVDYERDVHRGWAMLEEGPDGAPRFPKVRPMFRSYPPMFRSYHRMFPKVPLTYVP